MDEVGAGTDPSEGMGFAVAALEEVYSKGATLLATTHFSEIKEFAAITLGFKNGCMGFDIQTLKPLYSLKIGQPGESNAFLIALRLGMDTKLIERAHEITYKEKKVATVTLMLIIIPAIFYH
jgi:dsDNA-specific endonuclease/ATPase MutS2